MDLGKLLENESNIYHSLRLMIKKLDLKVEMSNIGQDMLTEISERGFRIGVLTQDEVDFLSTLEERAS
tara:strand:- start:4463 stop:4666 length:204 start_codon:yes stop_codon:yes gene_type:complete